MIARVGDAAKEDAIRAVVAAGSAEICGLFVPDEAVGYRFVQMDNQASQKKTHFEMAEEDFAPYRDKAGIMLVHSHPHGPNYPSYHDIATTAALGITSVLIAPSEGGVHGYEFIYFGPAGLHGIEARTYRFGVTDCFACVRDIYAQSHQIILPDMPREWGWWEERKSYFERYYRSFGFHKLQEGAMLQEADVFIARLRAPVDNHSGYYAGNGLIIHHLAGRYPVDKSRLVTTEPVTRMQPFIHYWLRHDTMKDTPC